MRKVWMVLCLLLCAGGAALLGTGLSRLDAQEKNAEALRQAEAAVEERLGETWQNTYENQAAEALFAQPKEEEPGEDLAVYTSPEGIHFHSQSEAWDQEKLEALYQELLRNRHGPELNTLRHVMVYPQSDDFAAASHRGLYSGYNLTLRFPSLPEEPMFTVYENEAAITLYDGDTNTTVEAMASSLSHEYGHHFTMYYMFEDGYGNRVYDGSEYVRLRGLTGEEFRGNYVSAMDYQRYHAWYIAEIAAEDYVVLMGSPNSREVADYYDVRECLNGRDEVMYTCRNAQVQENLSLPLANQVPGLAAYFYGFLGEPAPDYSPQEITLEVERNSVGYDLIGGYKSFVSYEITWNKAYGEDAVYTLVCFDETDYEESFRPIRTVTAGEEASAEVGCVTSRSGNRITSLDDGLAEGTRTFLVTVILPDGTMYCSEPLQYTF